MKLQLTKSVIGLIFTSIYLMAVLAVIAWLFYSSANNPADSGEGGVLLVFLAMPWISMLPSSFVGPMSALGCILLNGFIIYCIFGGIRLRKT